jgi:hypothetical protein
MLCTSTPATLVGGVLADTVDRKLLIAVCMAVNAATCLGLAVAEFTGLLHPAHIYIATGVFQVARRLEAPARSSLVGVVVPEADVPRAVSATVLTQNVGEILAPLVFAAAASFRSLGVAFGFGALFYVIAAILPLTIGARGLAAGAGMEKKTVRTAARSLLDGLAYIFRHPLLPGLYALDWGMTLFTFYRELFPFLIESLWVDMRVGLSPRAAAAALTICNYVGGTAGSALTFAFANYPYKGRAVCIATLVYGLFASLLGVSSALIIALFTVCACGAADAVGMTMRKSVVMLTTPDAMRGRANAGHSLAANSANALGQIYVAALGSAIGTGPTLMLGGGLTWLAVGIAVTCFRTLWWYTDAQAREQGAVGGKGGFVKLEEIELDDPSERDAIERDAIERDTSERDASEPAHLECATGDHDSSPVATAADTPTHTHPHAAKESDPPSRLGERNAFCAFAVEGSNSNGHEKMSHFDASPSSVLIAPANVPLHAEDDWGAFAAVTNATSLSLALPRAPVQMPPSALFQNDAEAKRRDQEAPRDEQPQLQCDTMERLSAFQEAKERRRQLEAARLAEEEERQRHNAEAAARAEETRLKAEAAARAAEDELARETEERAKNEHEQARLKAEAAARAAEEARLKAEPEETASGEHKHWSASALSSAAAAIEDDWGIAFSSAGPAAGAPAASAVHDEWGSSAFGSAA